MALQRIIYTARCRPGAGTFIEVAGRELAVFLLDGPTRVRVIDNACPHAGGNLSGGAVQGEVVTCLLHDWQFDLRTGVCVDSARARVRCYPAEIRGGEVWADLDAGYCD